MNKRLQRVIDKFITDSDQQDKLQPIFQALSDLIEEYEQDRYIMERSMSCMSDELNEKNKELSDELVKNKALIVEAETNLARLKSTFDGVPEAMMSFYPGGAPRAINQAGLDIVGLTENEFLSMSSEENLRVWLKLLKKPKIFRNELLKISSDNSIELQGTLKLINGTVFQYYGVPAFLNKEYLGRTWFWKNITREVNHQKILEFQAYHDSLTKIPNREKLFITLDQKIDLAKKNNKSVSVLFIDVDNFKYVNDIAGHIVGDQFIVEVAYRLSKQLTKGDTFGRLGGDEFLAICPDSDHEKMEDLGSRIQNELNRPLRIKGHTFTVTCSIGISRFPKDGPDVQSLIRKSDMAMYEAKRSGKNTYRFFDEKLENEVLERIRIEAQLQYALVNNELSLVFQPKISLENKKIVGVEALLRWIRPNGEVIGPDKFIPVAEQTGLITQISDWVVKTACITLKRWEDSELEDLKVSVNISSFDLAREDFSRSVINLFEAYQVDPRKLEFELTESILIDRGEETKSNIKALQSAGFELSIDDFGTGYCNFSYLQELNLDYLKIDKSIVSHIDSNPKQLAIARSVIDVGHNLGVLIVAEGVETFEVQNCLIQIDCDYCQGFYYSRPLSEEDLENFVLSELDFSQARTGL